MAAARLLLCLFLVHAAAAQLYYGKSNAHSSTIILSRFACFLQNHRATLRTVLLPRVPIQSHLDRINAVLDADKVFCKEDYLLLFYCTLADCRVVLCLRPPCDNPIFPPGECCGECPITISPITVVTTSPPPTTATTTSPPPTTATTTSPPPTTATSMHGLVEFEFLNCRFF